ncbi:MAG: hypothetical protein KGJ89_01920 [Patescibacteria group bacterium]|nr:hypothetical protein [Patescibacteria group bacterium]MDE2015635.1 hypothetical protein [Patescibacteria group bacterium]MDE2226692.1 hypothetical protein [Patescibacteria group bacterium]
MAKIVDLSPKEKRAARSLACAVAVAICKDEKATDALFCSTFLARLLEKRFSNRRNELPHGRSLRSLVAEELSQFEKRERIKLTRNHRRIVVSGLVRFCADRSLVKNKIRAAK